MTLLDYIKFVAELITSIGVIGGCIIWIYNAKKKGKNWAKQWVRDCINLDDIKEQLEAITTEQSLREERLKVLEQVNLIQLKARLKPCCLHILKRGIISPAEFEVLTIVANLYFNLGGNGTIKHLLEQIEKLPIGEVNEEDEIF